MKSLTRVMCSALPMLEPGLTFAPRAGGRLLPLASHLHALPQPPKRTFPPQYLRTPSLLFPQTLSHDLHSTTWSSMSSIQKVGKEGELPTTDGSGHGRPTWVLAEGLLLSINRRRESRDLKVKAAALLVVTWPPVSHFPICKMGQCPF